ncbi:hypothetical protein [Bacillus sp. Marseille-Q3570]|uniref:hypothetical protein n=1 Tax=Bacillus sp. Marseille-Q3570 TaxID=2963522 RepID=UPI0021B80FC5|nr:hypothetical protein [Bacillus sp. Marseille-Q3570]
MIYYQFDPETDLELLKLIDQKGKLPDTISSSLVEKPFVMKDNEEAYVFSNDEEDTGFLWLNISENKMLEITFLFMYDQMASEKFQSKLIDFSVKRAKYLQLRRVAFNKEVLNGRTELSQLKEELGCIRMESKDPWIECILG